MSFEDIPSKNPADEGGGLAGVLRGTFRKLVQGLDGQLPAVVIAYDAASNVATVRPQIAIVGTSGNVVPRPQIARVPCLAMGAGGFALRFPIKPGDRGWIEASDRDISLYLQAQTDARPNTNRLHNFSDGRFIPDSFAQAVIAGEDADAVTLQSYDGSVKIAMDDAGVRIDAPQMTVDSPVTFKQPTLFEGRMTGIDGMTVNDIPYETHLHEGVWSGPELSGGPVSSGGGGGGGGGGSGDVPEFASTVTVTVGTGGDYATINAALTALTKMHVYLASPPIVATVRLLAGFTMAEQVLVHGINLGWIVITADDAVVPIDTSVLVDNIQPIYGINAKPAFGVIQGGVGPRIGCKFDLRRQITGDTDPEKYGLFVSGPGSACHIMNFTRGFINAPGAGIYANRHGMINAYGADVSGAGTYGVYANRATINCHNIVANNCGSYGIAALYNARISAFEGFANNAGLYACYANYGSQIMFQGGEANNAGTFGIYADNSSVIDCAGAQANTSGTRGIFANGASTINASGASATNAGARGVMAINASRINFENGNASGATGYGIIASSASTINANGANGRKGVSDSATDIAVTGGSTINAVGSTGGLNVTKNTVTAAGIIFRV